MQCLVNGDHEDGGEHQRGHGKRGGREGVSGQQSIEGDRRHDQECGERDQPGRQAAGQAEDPERLLGLIHVRCRTELTLFSATSLPLNQTFSGGG